MSKKRGPMGHGAMHGEKAKDFKGSMKNLLKYLSVYKLSLLLVLIFAVGSTVFMIVGPKILGNATTEIFNGLVSKVSGGAGIDFGKVGQILIFLLVMYGISALFSYIQSFLMTGVTQKITYQLRKAISEKINRMPMKYFDGKPTARSFPA